jgi:hypothetical protein
LLSCEDPFDIFPSDSGGSSVLISATLFVFRLAFQDSHNKTIATKSGSPLGRLAKTQKIFWGSEWLCSVQL